MAYALRYFYEQKHEDGKVIRLEIYKRNATAAAMEIGDVVQGLSLNIEGGEDNIDTPVVTSSLVMTFVDAYDHPESYTKKCGNWAEFYTPDATLWKIIVKAKDPDSSFRTIWGGYVTPDSYEESLVYGGSVTITARDNIGHMSDFPFDAEGDSYGTISLRELIESAWAKIESPMELAWGSTWLECEGVSAPDTRMNVAAFAEKNWREAVEMALYGYGAVLRYIGENKVIICPLEGIPSFGTNEVERTEPIFMAGATRMLTPALKRIEESASYDLVSDLQPLVKQEDFSGNSHILDSDDNIRGFSLSNTQEGKGWLNTLDYTAIYFDASNYAISGVDASERNEIKKQMYVVANRPFSEFTEYSRYMSAQNVTIKVQFGTGLMRNVRENYLTPKAGKITSVCCRVSVTQNGITQYYDVSREWKTTSVYQTIAEEAGLTEINVPVDMSEYSGEVLIKVELGGIDATIPFVQIQSFSFETFGEDTYLATNRVNTNYDENNNVIITRDPAIAPAYNKTFLPSVIKNGIYVQSGCTYLPASAWSWKGQSAQQMAVFNHLQLICYYAKPNNILEGNIVNADVTRFAQIWDWEGKEHILVAGRFNFLSGYIEGAILREFARYDSMWGSIPSTQLPATEQTSVSNIEAAAQGGSSSNASTYTNNTTVNIGTGGGGSGASSLGELSDVDTTASVAGSVLFFNGSEWVDKSMQLILTELKQLGDFFYKTEDGLSIGTRFNFFSEKEISANGLNNGSGGSGAGLVSAILGATSLGATLANDNSVVFNAYATNEVYKATQGHASRIGVLESQVGRLETSFGDGKFLPLSGGNVDSLTINGNAVIHAGNIGQQSVNFANSTEKWNAINQNKDANDYVCQHAWVNSTSPSSKHLPTIGSRTAGTIVDISNSVSHLQLFCGYQAGNGLWYRGCYDSSWYDWNRLVISSELGALAYKNGLNGSDVGLGNVENVALSTWNGSTNIVTLGTITSGTWNGSKIANAYLANSAITIAGNSVSLGGSIGASAITEALIGSGNSFVHTANYDKYALSLTGGDLTGAIRFLNSAGITFVGSESATNDTGDLIFRSFDNTEIGRIWLDTSLDFMLRYGSNDESKYILHSGNIENYNAGSATKLKTSRTIWGQSFNGEANIAGAFSGATTGEFSSNVNIGGSLKVSDTLKAESNAFFGNAFDYGFCIARAAVDVPYTFLALQSKGTYKADIFRVYNDYSVQFIHPTTFNTIKIGGATLSWDGTALKVDKSFYSEEEISANGLNLNASLPSISITDIMGKTAIGDSNSFIYWSGTRWMTSTLGSNAFSSEQYLPSYGGTITGNLTINNTMTAANGVISGLLSAKTLTLTSTDSVSHISFSRASANYISAPSGGYIGFITNGRGVTLNNASLIISSSDNIIYCGTNNMMQLGYGERRWSGIYATNGDFSGDLVAGTFKTTSTVACGGRLRITSSNGPNSFGFFTATAHSSALNIGIMNIGTNYGGASSIDSTAVDVVAMSLYRGIVGIGRAYTYEEFKTQYNSSIKLAVDGNVSVAGTVTQASDIRKKYVLEPINLSLSEIANAPLFTFKWNCGTDNNVHLGTSAQYWEGVTPWLVSGADFKGLDYASLGVAMGISLAKKTQELENRVKLLEDRLNN